MLALVVIMLILLVWALVAGRLARFSVTMPLAMLVAGVALTAGSDPVFVFDVDFASAEHVVEGILAILLFTDAVEVPGGMLGREPRLTLRLLLVALPLSLGLAWFFGWVLLGGVGIWVLLVLATVVMPVDLAPAAAFVRDKAVPERLRQLLNTESGLNDGLIAPIFLVALAAATAAEHDVSEKALDAVPSLALAVVIGGIIGALAARGLRVVQDAGWTQPSALRIGVLALPLLAYGGAVVAGANGFVAAFVAGVFFEPQARRLPPGALHLVEDVGELLSLALWFIFGAVVNRTVAGGSLTWQIVLYVLLALSVVVSLFGIVNTLVLTVFERTRELGMLRAIGLTRGQVKRMIRQESVITALIGAVIGIVLGLVLASLLAARLDEISFTVPAGQLVIFAVLSVVVGIFAAIWPARRAARLNPLEALQYE